MDKRRMPKLRRLGKLCVRCENDPVFEDDYPKHADDDLAYMERMKGAFCLFCSVGVGGDSPENKQRLEDIFKTVQASKVSRKDETNT